MWNFLVPLAYKRELPAEKVDSTYKSYRRQAFLGIFIGYAGFYIVCKNLSIAILGLGQFGFEKGELSIVLSISVVVYVSSRFLMENVSDCSNVRVFLPLGPVLAAVSMMLVTVSVQFFGLERRSLATAVMAVLNFLVGWFDGMRWPPCERVMTHWSSATERGTMMSTWDCAHNMGGALVGPMAVYSALRFGSWFYGADSSRYFLTDAYVFPAAVATLVALVAYRLIRDTSQSCGLPSIKKYRNDYPKNYSEKQEEVLTVKETFFKHMFNNKMLWYITIANASVYMVRYGCLDWVPTSLREAWGYDIEQAGWVYSAYEFAAIPGALVYGWPSDRVFKGGHAMTTTTFMAIVAVFISLYWQRFSNYMIATLFLIAIGLFIYESVMLIGVQALDLAPKSAAGTIAGLTGFFSYFFGAAIPASVVLGYVAEMVSWDWIFVLLLIACALPILSISFTYRDEKALLVEGNKK